MQTALEFSFWISLARVSEILARHFRFDARSNRGRPPVFGMDGEIYLRPIARANPDQSPTFFCPIENGMVLSAGRALDPEAAALAAFQKTRDKIGDPALIIEPDIYRCRDRR